ncbi:putative membrane protein [Oopsacas minuta]|uniref:Endosomal/lysosomal proton channel TMEM175 n=1 Tax=Oopsacas minuta TaxID=111878 RepID=A0AAV7JGT6_9METZ|nr:putative membrane protein [Oopsacas minuta]
MATVVTEKDISTELGGKESIGVGQYTKLGLPRTYERNIYWSREPSPLSADDQPNITQNDLSASLSLGFPTPKWDQCEHERFEYFCDIYLAVIATLVLASFKLTLLIPLDKGMSLYDHLARIYPNTVSWPAIVVNGIVISVGYVYIISIWLNQIRVIYLYPMLDKFVVWLNLGILASLTFLPIASLLYGVESDAIVTGFFCFFVALAGIFQCTHIIYVYIYNYYESFRDGTHENSNFIVLFIQLHATLDIPIRVILGYALWFIPSVGNSFLFIVYLIAIISPFDSVILEKIFIYTQKKTKRIERIVSYLQHYKRKLSNERFMHFTDGVFALISAMLIIDTITVFSKESLAVINFTQNFTEIDLVPILLKLHANYFYSFVWAMCVLCTFWIVSYNMFYRVKVINRMVLFLKFFGLFLANFIPQCAFILGKYGSKESYYDRHMAVVLSLSLVIAIGIVQLIGWSYFKFFSKTLSSERNSVAKDIKMVLMIITLPSLSFILMIIELFSVNSITLLKLFIIFLVQVPILALVETLPNLCRFIGICYDKHGDKVTGVFYTRS